MSKNLYHEIKNHLSVCDLYLEVLRKTLEKKEINDENLQRAIKTIKNSLTMINESTVELRAGVEDVKFSEVNLHNLISEVYTSALAYVENKNIDFINDVPVEYKIIADKNKMFSIFINLVKNAIEAIKEIGFVKIYVLNDIIQVENSGEMIAPEDTEKIFNEDFTTKIKGDGIGLFEVKRMLKLQNFDVTLTKSDLKSTIFSIKKAL